MTDKKIICPMMGGQECVKDGAIRIDDGKPVLVACRFWVVVHGRNPQTNEELNTGDCAMAWTPVLLIENTKINRETGAAIESFRNETVATTQQTQQILMRSAGMSFNLIDVMPE